MNEELLTPQQLASCPKEGPLGRDHAQTTTQPSGGSDDSPSPRSDDENDRDDDSTEIFKKEANEDDDELKKEKEDKNDSSINKSEFCSKDINYENSVSDSDNKQNKENTSSILSSSAVSDFNVVDDKNILRIRKKESSSTSSSTIKAHFICDTSTFKQYQGYELLLKIVGFLFATSISTLYYVVPGLSGFFLLWPFFSWFSVNSLIGFGIWFVLAFAPIYKMPWVANSWLYRSTAFYFGTSLYAEHERPYYQYHKKPIIFLCCPHGVISMAGISIGSFLEFRECYTACASAVMIMPLLRQIIGAYGICESSRKEMMKTLKDNRDVVLYPGGLAELFLSDFDKETLYFEARKGCIKLAMESGADVCPYYFYGNTRLFKLVSSRRTAKLSRLLHITITFFWGVFGLPIPFREKLVGCMGSIIEMPDCSTRKPEEKEIQQYHEIVKNEIRRVYTTHRHLHPEYAQKELNII